MATVTVMEQGWSTNKAMCNPHCFMMALNPFHTTICHERSIKILLTLASRDTLSISQASDSIADLMSRWIVGISVEFTGITYVTFQNSKPLLNVSAVSRRNDLSPKLTE